MKTHKKRGSELEVGDLLRVLWHPGAGTITRFSPYTGPLLFRIRARVAHLDNFPRGVSIEDDAQYEVITHS